MGKENVKQIIVVRKDLNMRRGKIASHVAYASMRFIIDNNDSEYDNELRVELKGPEAQWLTGSGGPIVLGIDSGIKLEDLIFQAELRGVEVHTVTDDTDDKINGGCVPTVTCAVFGPDESRILDEITKNLKVI